MAQNINAAPQIASVSSLYSEWAEVYDGGLDDFFTFMTTPSVERTQWLKSRSRYVSFEGPYCVTKYS